MSKGTPTIDMTPMVDLAFLLVTFFMLTATAIPDEPLIVDTPSSISEVKIPENNVLTITIGKDSRVFFNVDGQYTREALLGKMGELYGIQFTPAETHTFAIMSSIGVPIGGLKQFLNLKPEERKAMQPQLPGIPVDSAHNELRDWVLQARLKNRKLRVAIKGDRDAEYPVVKEVLNSMKDIHIFNLITGLEKGGS